MLIYEKKLANGEKHLFGTLENIPGENDLQLTYKDKDGEVLDIEEYIYFYNGEPRLMFGGASQRQLPDITDKQVNVWLGDKLIIGLVEA